MARAAGESLRTIARPVGPSRGGQARPGRSCWQNWETARVGGGNNRARAVWSPL